MPFLGITVTEFVPDSVTESVFSLKLWWSLFLVKFEAFTINGNDGVLCQGLF